VTADIDRPEWQARAACHGKPVAWFFPHLEGDGSSFDVADAQARALEVCATCPVLLDCRAHALRHEREGVWGGTTAKERRRLRRQLGIRVVERDADQPDHDRVERVNRAVHLWRQGWRPAEIAGELGVDVRTVHRLLADGEWHDREQLLDQMARAVPPGKAFRVGERRRTATRRRPNGPGPRVRGVHAVPRHYDLPASVCRAWCSVIAMIYVVFAIVIAWLIVASFLLGRELTRKRL
jgi:WhiB family redox-sensing transcriptional regulator